MYTHIHTRTYLYAHIYTCNYECKYIHACPVRLAHTSVPLQFRTTNQKTAVLVNRCKILSLSFFFFLSPYLAQHSHRTHQRTPKVGKWEICTCILQVCSSRNTTGRARIYYLPLAI